MRTFVCLAVAALCVWPACGEKQTEQARQVEPAYDAIATIQEIMLSIIDPEVDIVFNSVATIVTADGIEERAPSTDEEWARVRRAALTVAEASNLLQMPGRRIARPGVKSENPGIELEPEEMQALVDQDRSTWNQGAQQLAQAATEAVRAVDAKDAAALFESGDHIEAACENCHQKYWYPNQPLPRFPTQAPPTSIGGPVGAQAAPHGTIQGHVRLGGKHPGNPVIRMRIDPMCAKINAGQRVIQETVAAAKDGSLANVFVTVQGNFPDTAVPAVPVRIDQRSCLFVPRVIGARVGQSLEARNSDDLLHTVHAVSSRGNSFNVSQPKAGMVQRFPLHHEETMLRLTCDLHRWMVAYVGIVSHPYFAVTDSTGVFTIADAPIGTREIRIWHERYGILTKTVQVKAGAATNVDFNYTGNEKPPM